MRLSKHDVAEAAEKMLNWLLRVFAALAVLLGGTAFIVFVLISVLRDLLVRQGAFGIDAPGREAPELGDGRQVEEEAPSSERTRSSGASL